MSFSEILNLVWREKQIDNFYINHEKCSGFFNFGQTPFQNVKLEVNQTMNDLYDTN